MRERHVPGLALAVVRDGKVIKARGYGLANVELNVPVTTETVFEIGSVTKQITAAAVLLLAGDGKLSLDDRINKHLPNLPDSWADITVRHLLTHTSGVRNYTGLGGFELSRRLKRDDFIKLLAAHPLNFRPGEQWSYGNSAYNLLGHVVESASGQSYFEFVNARIFKPLGMNSTRDRDPRNVIPNRADGYEWEDGRLVGRDHDLTDVFSAGALTSTVLDLARWDAALHTDRLLKASTRAEMWTPVRLAGGQSYPYGYGWNTLTWRGRRLVFHGGQTAGFAASIQRFTDDRLTVIVLSNLGDIGLGSEIARRGRARRGWRAGRARRTRRRGARRKR
ncbi:MAG TPA: serine hydrolase domain-containing protein [Pyrinomonadaceae bacterium]|nr:serine hydrolase domain-containing protein [Pyrinomonadaceae bacterium]